MTIQVDAPGGGIDGVTVSANAGFVVNTGALLTLSNYQGSIVKTRAPSALNGSTPSRCACGRVARTHPAMLRH